MISKALKYKTYILLAFIGIWFSSCHDDSGYSLDNFKVSLATVNSVSGDNSAYYFTLDNGETLWPAANPFNYKAEGKQRVFLNYTILSDSAQGYDHWIKVNNISNILTKDIQFENLASANINQYGNDPTQIVSLWLGDNYLNFRFKFMIGGEQIQHSINLLADSDESYKNDTIHLAFKHNAYDAPQRYEEISYAAFDLNSIIENNPHDDLVFIVETIDFDNQRNSYLIEYDKNNHNINDGIDLEEEATNNLNIK